MRMTAHESTLQRGREKRGSGSEAGVTFPFIRQGNSELTCETPQKIKKSESSLSVDVQNENRDEKTKTC